MYGSVKNPNREGCNTRNRKYQAIEISSNSRLNVARNKGSTTSIAYENEAIGVKSLKI